MAESMHATNGTLSVTNGRPPSWFDGLPILDEAVVANRPPVLYLVHRVPYPPDKGDRIRNWNVLRSVSRHAAVHLVSLADEPVTPMVADALNQVCARVATVPAGGASRWLRGVASLALGGTITEGMFWSPALARQARAWAREVRYHAVLTSSSSMVPYLDLPELRPIPCVVDMVDVDSEKWLDYALTVKGWKSWLYHTEGWRLRKLEKHLTERVRSVVLVSEAEANLYRHFCNRGSVHAVTNGVAMEYFKPMPQPKEHGCVFVGALDYLPNVEGITWFCHEVWPELRRHRPNLTVDLVGRRPEAAVKRLAQLPGVRLVGQVPDVRPYVARGAVAIVPVRIARGVQNKVLEALAMAKAVVASPQSIAGLKALNGRDLLVAATAEEWVEKLDNLLADAELRHQLGSAGRRYVEENHRWERCLQPFRQLLGLPE